MGPHIPPHQIRSHRATRKTRHRSYHRADLFDSLEPRTLLSTTPADPSGRPTPSGPPTASAAIFLSISAEATTYGTGVNLVARVLATGIPTTDGTLIDFIDQQPTGDILLSAAAVQNNTVSYNWTNGTVGDHQIIAEVAPSQPLPAAASEPMAIAVAPGITSTTLSSTGAKLIAHVTSAAAVNTGTISFFSGTRELATLPVASDGTATFIPAKLAAGKHTIVAAYNGAINYIPSTSTVLTVKVRNPHDLNAVRALWGQGRPRW